jgi:tRNA(Arg) A34 adenosine deaminase TadA
MTTLGDDPTTALMRACIAEATANASSGGGGPFAALIVRDGRAIARGANAVTATFDATAHAEVQAIRAGGVTLRAFDLSGCELYASCEPCPMCLAAAYWARVDRVYFAATRFHAAGAGFDDARIYAELGEPTSQRTLPLVHLPLPEAADPFEAWIKNPNRVPY